jgi:hypothetical protein
MKITSQLICLLFFTFAIDAKEISADAISSSPVNWQTIEAAPNPEGMAALIRITRIFDIEYSGSKQMIDLRFTSDFVSDGDKAQMKLSPEVWKAMVLMLHQPISKPKSKGYLAFRTAPTLYHTDDGKGKIPRFLYHVRIIDRECGRFETIKKYDDGA